MNAEQEKPPVRRDAPEATPLRVTVESAGQIASEPLRALALDALAQGEAVGLLVGVQEQGARVETLLFTPSGRAAQSTGSWVFSGLWNGAQVITMNGHALDRDGSCFCRTCDAANGYELRDED
jgi:hypothetical protein